MPHSRSFQFDLTRQFPKLPGAPIAEAMIGWQAKSAKPVTESGLKQLLTDRFPGYSCHGQRSLAAEFSSSAEAVEFSHSRPWTGFRLERQAGDEHVVAQVGPGGVVVSRLPRYAGWDEFVAQAQPFWSAFQEQAAPVAIDRLSVRFVNQIPLERSVDLNMVLNHLPPPPLDGLLEDGSFLIQETLRVPGTPYRVNQVRMLQASDESDEVLILDLEVFAENLASCDRSDMDQHLARVRYIKNRLFFAALTDAALQRFGSLSS